MVHIVGRSVSMVRGLMFDHWRESLELLLRELPSLNTVIPIGHELKKTNIIRLQYQIRSVIKYKYNANKFVKYIC